MVSTTKSNIQCRHYGSTFNIDIAIDWEFLKRTIKGHVWMAVKQNRNVHIESESVVQIQNIQSSHNFRVHDSNHKFNLSQQMTS